MDSTFQRAFAGGELAPGLYARADLAKYATGLKTCRNFMVLRNGGVTNRKGTRFINQSRDNSTTTRILRYVHETIGQSVLIESGAFYLRFYLNGALVTLAGVAAYNGATAYVIGDIVASGGANYYCTAASTGNAPPNVAFWYPMPSNILEVPIPFGNSGFAWTQSGNTITLTSSVVPPHELIYVSLTRWVIRRVTTAPGINPPTAITPVAGGAGAQAYQFIVTSGAQKSYEESVASAIGQVLGAAVPTVVAPVVVSWTPPAVGAVAEYYVYCDPTGDGTFGFVGTATGATSFHWTGVAPDFTITPPQVRVLFNAAGDYPQTAAYYQQRRFFGNTLNDPDAVYGSRVGFPSNFNISSPLQDDDAITFRIAGGLQRNAVRHLLGLKALIVLTDGGEWTIGQAKTALTPANLPADQETYVGISAADPVIIGNSILYVQARGSLIRDLQFDLQVDGLNGRDLTLYASHLFDGFTISQIDYQQTPNSIVWCCRSDGTLLGLTYIREQDVWGWHRHDTGASGLFEDVCVVPEAGEDAVYVLVRRTIGGAIVRYIERIEPRHITNFNTDAFFMDAGLTYNGAPATSIAGLGHLNGQVVAVLCDGAVIFNGDPADPSASQYTVAAGTISKVLPASSVIHAGLPITADIETLDLDVAGLQVQLRDKKKRVNELGVLLEASCRTFKAGPDAAHLTKVKLQSVEANQAGVPYTGLETINLTSAYNNNARVFLRQTDPLPITVLGLLPLVDIGG